MLTQQAMLASLKAMHDSIKLESAKLSGVLSTVKVPDDASAKAALRGVIKDAMKAPEGWNRLENGAEAEESLNRILEDKEATSLLIEQVLRSVSEEVADQVESTKVEATSTMGDVEKKLNDHVRSLEFLQKEAPALIAGANLAKNRALKVTGATGLSEPEALKKYENARAAIVKSHSQLVKAIAKHEEYVEKLGGLYELPDGSTWSFPVGTEREDRKAMREDAKDQEAVKKSKQLEIYSAHGVSGSVVDDAKDTHKPFNVPKHLKSGDYEKLKRDFRTWATDPAVVKAYPLLLQELNYMYDAVDPIKAMHLLPPSLLDGYSELLTVSDEFKQERELQNKALYEELLDQSSQDIVKWLPQIHSAGQDGKLKISVQEGDGVRFMYCLLAAHVRFTSTDQNTHMTTLMNMKDLFSAGKVTNLKHIEQARAMLKAAKDVGVVPTYDLVGMVAIQSMAEIDGVRDRLRTEHLLEPEVLSNTHFDQMDCSRILQTALTIAHSVIESRVRLDDSKHKGIRKSKEAGAEITAMTTKTVKDAKRKRAELVQNATEKYELDEWDAQAIKSSLGQMCPDFDQKSHKQQKLQVQARALTLANGQKLSEPTVKASLKELQKGGKNGKNGSKSGGKKGGGKYGGKSGGGRGGRGGRGGTCMIKDCGKETEVSSISMKPFAICYDCNEKSKQGKTLYKTDGTEWRPSKRIHARQVEVAEDAPQTIPIRLGSETHNVDARTVSLLRRIREEDLDVHDGTKKQDPMDDLRAVLGNQ